MITIPGTPSNHANMYLMSYSFLPAPADEEKAMCASRLVTPVPDIRASGDFPTCATAMWRIYEPDPTEGRRLIVGGVDAKCPLTRPLDRKTL
jgi:hypothetical protein